jgi:hypothetical protein
LKNVRRKYEETEPFSVADIVALSHDCFSGKQVREAELAVLDEVQWRCSAPTVPCFLALHPESGAEREKVLSPRYYFSVAPISHTTVPRRRGAVRERLRLAPPVPRRRGRGARRHRQLGKSPPYRRGSSSPETPFFSTQSDAMRAATGYTDNHLAFCARLVRRAASSCSDALVDKHPSMF